MRNWGLHHVSKDQARPRVSAVELTVAGQRGPGAMVAALFGSVVGVMLQLQLTVLPSLLVHVGVGLAGLLGLALAWRWGGGSFSPVWWRSGLVSLAMVALAWTVTGWRGHAQLERALPSHLEGRDVELVGIVAGLPRRDDAGSSFEFRVEKALQSGKEVSVPPLVRLSWRLPVQRQSPELAGPESAPPPRVAPGERWRLNVRLFRPYGVSNPAGFDAEWWLWSQGIGATGMVRGSAAGGAQRLDSTWQFPIQQARHAMRDRLREAVSHPRSAGVMVALLAGDQAAISEADWSAFRTTGVAHLISVSGVHVTMFAWLATIFLRHAWRWAGRWQPRLLWAVPTPVVAAVGGVVLAALYAAFSGWGVPSQRTVLMLATVVALRLTGRQWPWPVVWLAAMNAVVWLDPWALLQAGFWLSFVAVGVLFAAGPLPLGSQPDKRWWHALTGMLRTQGVVTVALAPLTLLLFGQFSLVGLLANLVAIPWVTLIVTPLTMLGALVPGLWWLAGVSVEAMLAVLHGMSNWPLAAIDRPALPLPLAILAVMGGVVLVLPWPRVWRLWGALLLWPALVYQPPRPMPGTFELVAADVGQGTALIVRTAQHTLVYDTGPPMGRAADAAQRVLLPMLRAAGERPNLIMVSHGDSDHAAGAATLANAFPQARWLSSAELPVNAQVEACTAGQRWTWDGVTFEVLHPRPEDHATGLSDNALSCVLRVGDHVSALLTGDITTEEETRLALDNPELRATLLVAAHHGSKTSSGPVWLNTLRPQWVVVQAGYRSRYGHPSPEVVRRFEDRQIPWVNTVGCGAARWHSAEPALIHCHRQDVRRYWHVQPEN